MMRLFGGWHQYREAPAAIVEEQTLVWIAERQAEAEKAEDDKHR